MSPNFLLKIGFINTKTLNQCSFVPPPFEKSSFVSPLVNKSLRPWNKYFMAKLAPILDCFQKFGQFITQKWLHIPQCAGEGFNPQHFYHQGDLNFRSGWVMGIMPCVYFFPPLALLIDHYKLDWKFQDFPLFPLIFSVFEKIVTKE